MRGWNSGENEHEDDCSDLRGTLAWTLVCYIALFLPDPKMEKYQYSFPFLVIFQTVKIK